MSFPEKMTARELADCIAKGEQWELYWPCLENKINGALIACINDHGPIDKLLVTSATKRILGAIKNA